MKRIVALLNLNRCLGPKSRASITAAAERWGAELVEITKPTIPGRHHFWQKAVLHRELPDDAHVLQLDTDILIRADAPSPFALISPDRLGLVRCNPGFCQWIGGRQQAIAHWAKLLDLPEVDVFTEYPNLGFLMYSTPVHRQLLEDVYAAGERIKWANERMPEQTILALLAHHRQVDVQWMPTIYNTCGLHRSEISHRGGMTTFIYHGCGDSAWVLPRMDWRRAAGFGRVHALLRRLPADRTLPLRGAEIGVYRGGMSARLLAHLPNLSLVMVDPWVAVGPKTPYHRSGDRLASRGQLSCDRDVEQMWRETEFARDRRELIFQTSAIAAAKAEGCKGHWVPDESLDFVFIDAIHTYEHVKRDVAAWMPKLKPGGVLGGHDYGKAWKIHKAVKRAVDELFGDRVEMDVDSTWFVRMGQSADIEETTPLGL